MTCTVYLISCLCEHSLCVLLGCLSFPAVASAYLVSHQVSTTHRVVPGTHFQAVRVAYLYIWHTHVRSHHRTILGSRRDIFLSAHLVPWRMLSSDSQDFQPQVSLSKRQLCVSCSYNVSNFTLRGHWQWLRYTHIFAVP